MNASQKVWMRQKVDNKVMSLMPKQQLALIKWEVALKRIVVTQPL